MGAAVNRINVEEQRPAGAKVVHRFKTDFDMAGWLALDANLEALKRRYPPERYSAKCDLIHREVYVWRKDGSAID